MVRSGKFHDPADRYVTPSQHRAADQAHADRHTPNLGAAIVALILLILMIASVVIGIIDFITGGSL